MKTSNALYQTVNKISGLKNRGYLMELDAQYSDLDNGIQDDELLRYRKQALPKERKTY